MRMEYFKKNMFIVLWSSFKSKQIATCKQCLNKQIKATYENAVKKAKWVPLLRRLDSVWTYWFWRCLCSLDAHSGKEASFHGCTIRRDDLWVDPILHIVLQSFEIFSWMARCPWMELASQLGSNFARSGGGVPNWANWYLSRSGNSWAYSTGRTSNCLSSIFCLCGLFREQFFCWHWFGRTIFPNTFLFRLGWETDIGG